MTRPARWAWTAAWLAAFGAAVAAADLKVTPVVTPDGKIVASFSVPSGFNADAEEMLHTGLTVTFAYTVDLKRPATLWWDRTLGSVSVEAKVKFDNLTGQYLVSRLIDHRAVSSDSTGQEDQMRVWATQFDRVPVEARDPLEMNAEYYVQVTLHVSPRQRFSLWPWGRNDGSGRADFTFVH